MTDLETVIVGGLIAAVIGPFILEVHRRLSDARSLERAIGGEISAILFIVEQRHYVDGIRGFLSLLKQSQPIDPTAYAWFTFSVRRNPFAVYDANLDKIGTLRGDLPERIARFYVLATAILEDVRDLDPRGGFYWPTTHVIERLEQMLVIFGEAIPLAQAIVKDVNDYPMP